MAAELSAADAERLCLATGARLLGGAGQYEDNLAFYVAAHVGYLLDNLLPDTVPMGQRLAAANERTRDRYGDPLLQHVSHRLNPHNDTFPGGVQEAELAQNAVDVARNTMAHVWCDSGNTQV